MQEDFISVPGNPLPDHAQCSHLQMADGLHVRVGQFAPSGAAAGTILLLQGRGECMERHFETIRDFNSRGLHVLSLDWRGQGGSPPAETGNRHGHVRSFVQFEEDAIALINEVMLPDCPPPYFICGNSMGAHVGLHLIARYTWFDAAIMLSPFIDVAPSKFPRWLKYFTVGLMSLLGLGRLKPPLYDGRAPTEEDFAGNVLTSDRVRYSRNLRIWQEAPQLAAYAPSSGWAFAALRSCRRLQKLDYSTPLKCPALMIIAGQDEVVSNEAIQQFSRYVPGAASVVINGARHEILSEAAMYRDQAFAAIDAFLADRLRG